MGAGFQPGAGHVSYSQRDIQITSDIRLMALSLKLIVAKDPRKAPMTSGMDRVVETCDALIKSGPPEYHHIIASVPEPAEIAIELRRAAYGRP